MADGHHQAALVVIDAAPVGGRTVPLVLFVDAARVDVLHARNLVALIQIEDGVKDGVLVRDIHDGLIREDLVHGEDEDVPFVGGVEIVAHEEPPAQEELAEFSDLGIGQLPVTHLDCVEPRVIKDVVVQVQVDGLLDGARLDTGEATDGGGEVAVGSGIVDGPIGVALPPIVTAPEFGLPVQADFRRRIHQAGKRPFGGLVPVRRQGEIEIFPSRVLPKGALRQERAH